MQKSIHISVRNAASRYVALDLKDRTTVIAEGRTAGAVVKKARHRGRPFSMMFIPAKGKTYVF